MRFVLQKCRKTIYWAILFVGISFIGIPSANALVIGGNNLGILCGPTHMEPVPIQVGSTYRYLTASSKSTVLTAGTDDRRILRQFVTVRSMTPAGTIAWKRFLSVQSQAIVSVDLDDDPPTYSIPDTVDVGDRNAVPAFIIAAECLSITVVTSGNQRYVAVAVGTTSSTGGPVPGKTIIQGKDNTAFNISILNINNGNVVREFRPKSKPNRFFLAFSSGIFDIDNDFNDELVLAYVRFVGDTRSDFIFEHYNIVTGALERTTTMTQWDESVIQK